MLNINFLSIGHKKAQFQALLDMENPDIIVTTELWLDGSTFSSEFLPGNKQIFH